MSSNYNSGMNVNPKGKQTAYQILKQAVRLCPDLCISYTSPGEEYVHISDRFAAHNDPPAFMGYLKQAMYFLSGYAHRVSNETGKLNTVKRILEDEPATMQRISQSNMNDIVRSTGGNLQDTLGLGRFIKDGYQGGTPFGQRAVSQRKTPSTVTVPENPVTEVIYAEGRYSIVKDGSLYEIKDSTRDSRYSVDILGTEEAALDRLAELLQ